MADTRPDVQQVIEVPVKNANRLNLGNVLIVGSIGYVLFKTFLLEERVNDLTVLLKRQQRPELRSRESIVTPRGPVQHAEDEYETSDDDEDNTHSLPERETYRNDDDGEDEVRIEEQPQKVLPHAEVPKRDVAIATSSDSAFVTTRQRRSGSELRRDSSKTGTSSREE
jgi:hypothetical protein